MLSIVFAYLRQKRAWVILALNKDGDINEIPAHTSAHRSLDTLHICRCAGGHANIGAAREWLSAELCSPGGKSFLVVERVGGDKLDRLRDSHDYYRRREWLYPYHDDIQ